VSSERLEQLVLQDSLVELGHLEQLEQKE